MKVLNATLLSEIPHQDEIDKGAFGMLPNGIYKTNIASFDDTDEKIVDVSYFTESSFYINSYTGNRFK